MEPTKGAPERQEAEPRPRKPGGRIASAAPVVLKDAVNVMKINSLVGNEGDKEAKRAPMVGRRRTR